MSERTPSPLRRRAQLPGVHHVFSPLNPPLQRHALLQSPAIARERFRQHSRILRRVSIPSGRDSRTSSFPPHLLPRPSEVSAARASRSSRSGLVSGWLTADSPDPNYQPSRLATMGFVSCTSFKIRLR